jgi:polysaccharide export outer membrane protein
MRIKTAFIFQILALVLAFAAVTIAQDVPCDGPGCYDQQGANPGDTTQSSGQYTTPTDSSGVQETPMGVSPGNPGALSDQSAEIQRALRQQQQQGQSNRQGMQGVRCVGPQCGQVLAPEEKTEFQKFVFTTTGEKLEIYGRSLFRETPSTFAPVEHIPVPADYVVGPDDEVLIRVWGQVDFNARVRVDRNGEIYLPRVGSINVAGIRYDQLTGYLKNSISRVFRNFDLTVTLGQLRSIQVYVVGQARRPGVYTVSALSTLVSAIFASGGPNVHGSMRHIELKRRNQVVTEFDLYDLLSKGDKSKDVQLLPGDVIYIPPVGKQVAVIGSVNLPAIYEIDDKTSIADQIAVAGGLSTTADGTRVLLDRIDDRSTRSVEELKFDDGNLAQLLHDGDILRVFPVSPQVQGSVILRGSVALPGRYPWHAGMRVSDLIPSKDTLITRDYWMRQSALAQGDSGWRMPSRRSEVDGMQQQGSSSSDPTSSASLSSADSPSLYPGADQGTQNVAQAAFEIRQRQQQQLREDRRWSDGQISDRRTNIVEDRASINWDYAVIQRLNKQDLSSELVTFNLANAINSPTSADDVVLQPGDVITIFSQRDLAVPVEKRTKFVWIEGEVKAPGIYRAKPGETLRELVEQAGGLTSSAYLFGSEFQRVSTKREQQREMNEVIKTAQRDLTTRARLVSASLDPQDKIAGQQELQYEQDAIEKLRAVQVTGRVVLELNPTDSTVANLPSIQLEDGDRFIIPARPATVGVVGAVYNQNSFLYGDRNTVGSYLRYAGGGTRDADSGRLFVVRANGSVVSKQMHRSIWAGSFENMRLSPGDAIVMPEKVKTTSVLKGLRDWSQVFAQFALGVAALKTIAP